MLLQINKKTNLDTGTGKNGSQSFYPVLGSVVEHLKAVRIESLELS
jgi:hypothetical protein